MVLPAILLALELGRVQQIGSTQAGVAVLAPRVAGLFVFVAPPLSFYGFLVLAVAAYLVLVELAKRAFFRRLLPASRATPPVNALAGP